TKLVPDLNLAEGRIFATGSEPKAQSFSPTKHNGFTDKQKLLMRHPGWEGGASFSQGVFSFYIR
ncbi:hypothetical protein D3OALGB2SA_3469, partial [Olavius algarvensis associated proteobacterium Delta 3]